MPPPAEMGALAAAISRATASPSTGTRRRVRRPSISALHNAAVPASRSRWRSRAATTRSLTASPTALRGRPAPSSTGGTGSTSHTRSIRSSSGPLSRRR